MALVPRKDRVRAHVVDEGVALDAEQGVIAAWVYLRRHGISQDVIVRVLSGPAFRRSAIAPDPESTDSSAPCEGELGTIPVQPPESTPEPDSENPNPFGKARNEVPSSDEHSA